jgi:hypothetical protein
MIPTYFHPIFADTHEQSLQCCVASIFGLCRNAVPILSADWDIELSEWITPLHGILTTSPNVSSLTAEYTIGLGLAPNSGTVPFASVFFRSQLHFLPITPPPPPPITYNHFIAITSF